MNRIDPKQPYPKSLVVLIAAFVLSSGLLSTARAKGGEGWQFFGGNLNNTHYAADEHKISPKNVGELKIKWVYETTPAGSLNPGFPLTVGDVSVPPAVKDGVLYFPDWAGNLHAVYAATGVAVWKKFLPVDYSRPGKFMLLSRNTPAVAGDRLIIGSEKHIILPTCPQGAPGCIPNSGAVVAAVDRHTGDLLWSVLVDGHPAAKITASPVVVGKQVIVGVSSWEEGLAIGASAAQFGGSAADPYPCCSFRGSVVSLDVATGAVLWQTYLSPGASVPDGILAAGEVGYVGTVVYGGSPSVDLERRQIYVATGNNYVVPKKAEQCERHRLNASEPPPTLPAGITCENLNDAVGNYVDSMLALDLATGKVRWAFRARVYDPFNHACAVPDFYQSGFPPVVGGGAPPANMLNCPTLPGPDFGFGQAPMLLKNVKMRHGKNRDLVGAGEKSGIFWALDADNGQLVWSTRVDPGGILGGMQWGSASDGRVIYTASSNPNNAGRDRHLPFYPNPLNPIYPGYPGFMNSESLFSGPGFGGGAWTLVNPPSDVVADGISTFIDGGNLKTITGFWSALDASTGEILWQRPLPTDGRPPVTSPFQTEPAAGSIHGSVTLANGVLYGGGLDGQGSMFAMDAKTGKILFHYNAQLNGAASGGVESSPAVVDGVVYWGTGGSRGGVYSAAFIQQVTGFPFTFLGLQLPNNKVYAFEIPSPRKQKSRKQK